VNINRKSVEKIQFLPKFIKNNRCFTRRPKYICEIILFEVLVRMRNVSDKRCRENQDTHFRFSNCFFDNRSVYELIRENVIDPDRP